MVSIPSNISLVSYAQGSAAISNMTAASSNASGVAASNSNVSIIYNDQELEAKLLAKDLEGTIRDGVSVLQLISNNTTPMTNALDTALLKSTIKTLQGIPQNADEPKRKLAQDVLSMYKIFQYVAYQTPSGDVYFAQPYSHQLKLHPHNFAFREYYKGAIVSKRPYLSNVINEVVTSKAHAIIAVPIYSQNGNKSLIGILIGGLNFTYFDQSLRSLNITNNSQRVVYVDNNGTAIVDSSSSSNNNKYVPKESLANLQSFKNAIAGKSGSIVESFNGTKMLVSYYPVKAVQRVWAVLLMKPI
jgi:hypothetical protein